MNQNERRIYLIRCLLDESERYAGIAVPKNIQAQKQLLRALMNVRMPAPVSEGFLRIQDEYLRKETEKKGITDYRELKAMENGIFLWQGDITTLKCGAVVNAANSQMTGCYVPCHTCIDNCIHTYAGIQLRNRCAEIMAIQAHEEETSRAKITPAYNLPDYVIHTVGPVIYKDVSEEDEKMLASCYRSCLRLAVQNGIGSIAFCCISTGEFRFPNRPAAEIAVNTVRQYREETDTDLEVIFNVFKDADLRIYEELLGSGHTA